MLYYIIPPIIIILSFSVLVFMLFKKADGVPEEIIDQQDAIAQRKKGVVLMTIGHFFLKVLEKIMQRSKLMSLKLHNVSNALFHRIKQKRQQQLEKRNALLAEEPGEIVREKEIEKPDIIEDEPRVIIRRSRGVEAISRVEKYAETSKTPPAEPVKEKMEDVLIKRIAVNPRDIEAYERLGDYYMEMENLVDSLECFRQVLRLSPVHHKAKMRIRKIERLLK